jgi:hypothetical protein
MERAALRLGFSFEAAPRDGAASVEKFLGFDALRPGLLQQWHMTGLMKGVVDEVPMVVFFLAPKSIFRRSQGALSAAFAFQGNPLPEFTLRRKGVLDSIMFRGDGASRANRAIDFSENPQFSRAYAIHGKDEPAIRRLFQPEVLATFAARPAIARRASSLARVTTLYRNLLVIYMPATAPGRAKHTLEFFEDARAILGIFKQARRALPHASQ